MSFKLIFFILIHLTALIYFIEVLRRVAKRANEYDLKDTRETLPLGFVRLRYVVILYVLTYLIWVVLSVFLYLSFIEGKGFTLGQPTTPSSDSILNL